MRCDPSLNPNRLNYDAAKYPCDGGIQFQHLFYTPKKEDDGKNLACALDEDGDNTAEYITRPVNLRVKQNLMTYDSYKDLEDIDNTDDKNDVEELEVEFRDAWGEAHVHAGKCNAMKMILDLC